MSGIYISIIMRPVTNLKPRRKPCEPPISIIRITSYNVCYTKLLRGLVHLTKGIISDPKVAQN